MSCVVSLNLLSADETVTIDGTNSCHLEMGVGFVGLIRDYLVAKNHGGGATQPAEENSASQAMWIIQPNLPGNIARLLADKIADGVPNGDWSNAKNL